MISHQDNNNENIGETTNNIFYTTQNLSGDPNLKGINTLDEPILETIKRDLLVVVHKTKIAMLPMTNKDSKMLQDWDLWGPLIFCLLLGLVLSWTNKRQNGGMIFILIFGLVWLGGLIVSLNSQFLGVNITISQSICILGYCMFAIVAAAYLNFFLMWLPSIFNVIISVCAGFYSFYAANVFIGQYTTKEKRSLVSYPIILFYLFLIWFTLV